MSKTAQNKASPASLRALALAPSSGFRTASVTVPEWQGVRVNIREPSSQAWLEWESVIRPALKEGEEEDVLTPAQIAHRNIKADVMLFIDVVLDEDMMPVFLPEDREQVQGIYGPVHARLLKQALQLSTSQADAEAK
ncbi:phage tail assembly chaperone [Pantoea ananatis]